MKLIVEILKNWLTSIGSIVDCSKTTSVQLFYYNIMCQFQTMYLIDQLSDYYIPLRPRPVEWM